MSVAIPVTSQERNFTAEFQPDRPNGLAREVEIGDGRKVYMCTVSRRLTTTIGSDRPVVSRFGRKSTNLYF